MLIEHMRTLPEISAEESAYDKKEYFHINQILTRLFRAKYPGWTKMISRNGESAHDADALPNGESRAFYFMLRNCAGRAPAEIAADDDEE
jgi:hypothetical protein